MIGAEAAIVRAAMVDSDRRKLKRDGARFVELRGTGVDFCVAVDQRFEGPVSRTALPHVDFVVADQDLSRR